MATFNAEVFAHHRRKDGTYPVKIRITHNRKSRYVATSLSVRRDDLTRDFKLKSPAVIDKANRLIAELRRPLEGVSPFALKEYGVDDVVALIRRANGRQTFSLGFIDYSRRAMLSKTYSTRGVYAGAVNSFERFVGGEVDVNDITASMVREYAEWYAADHRSNAAYNIALLGHLYRMAKDEYNDEDADYIVIPRDPFRKVSVKRSVPQGQHSIGAPLIQMIIDERDLPSHMRFALDVFLLSFALCGMNMADMYEAEKPVDGTVVYYRRKVRTRRADRGEMRLHVPDCVMPIAERLEGGERWLDFGDIKRESVSYKVNRSLRLWAEERGIKPFTLYAARKSWASIARSVGVEKATIDESLAHVGEYRVADIYIERDWSLIDEANRKVLAVFDWSGLNEKR